MPRIRLTRQNIASQRSEWAGGVFVFLTCCFLFQPSLGVQVKPSRQVLILNQLGNSYPLTNLVDQGIRTAFDNSRYQLESYREYGETVEFHEPAVQQQFRDLYLRRVENRKPDVIITVEPSALRCMVETHHKSFPGVPVVFCLLNGLLSNCALDSDFTGVEGDVAAGATLAAPLRFLPDTQHVVVVGGETAWDRQQQAVVKEQLTPYVGHLNISSMTGLVMADLLERLRHLPRHTLVLLAVVGHDAAGTLFNQGEVEGDVSSAVEQGRVAGGMALRMINGEKPGDLPTIKDSAIYMFDERALKRWRMKESALPPDSIVLDRPPSIWKTYERYVLAGILVFLAQSVAIFALLWQRARRKKIEAELRVSEQKFSKAFRLSPLGFTLVSLVNYRFLEVNDTFEQYTGWTRHEVIGRTPLEIKIWVDTNQSATFMEQLRAQGAVRGMEILLCRKDGQVWTGLVASELIDLNGEPCALTLIADITVRKEAERALADVSRKLVEVQEQERTRIARDLHDDINQRLALVAIDIEELKRNLPESPAQLIVRLTEIRGRLTEVSTGVQSISHELHSPQLEYLGIVAAIKSFCKEFAARQSVQVDFEHDDILQLVSNEVSLCLFRVVQEALHNAVKHSQVRLFQVTLTCPGNQLDLTIADRGSGFDPETAMSKGGLGLISMRERVRLANGTIAIESKPMGGTTIRVRVPFRSGRDSQRAAG
ncbi:MAG TPA: PAS domain-containing sensor histidine kinase [Terriglobales bacterium]|nr:PAS domain-containing sensor histidine kinase [Terriglobales bacterium]